VDKDVIKDLQNLYPNNARNDNEIKMFGPKDSEQAFCIKIVGSHRGDCGENNEWELWAHKAILVVYLEYFRSAMDWYKLADDDSSNHMNVVHLD
jgi:hypothetical protein